MSDKKIAVQKANYKKIVSCGSYSVVGIVCGIEYVCNQSNLGFLIAIDHKNKLAKKTHFLEMNDFTYRGQPTEYAILYWPEIGYLDDSI